MHHPKDNLPIYSFETPQEFEAWLKLNHTNKTGFWLRIFKKGSGIPTINYEGALLEALCYGWIDGLLNKFDEKSYMIRYTPRRPKSVWSQKNVNHVKDLIASGRMRPEGLAQVEAAKADGRWDAAYSSSKNMEIQEDFLAELAKFPDAVKTFESMNRSQQYSIYWRIHTARTPKTREKRIQTILDALNRGELLK